MNKAEAQQIADEIKELFPDAYVQTKDHSQDKYPDLWIVIVRGCGSTPLWEQHFFILNSSYDWNKLKGQLEVLGVLLTPGEECYVVNIVPLEQGQSLLDADN